MPNTRNLFAVAVAGTLAGTLVMFACNGYLDVTNPGPINDTSLYTADAVPALVTGISSDLSNEYDEITRISSIAGDESGHGGSYGSEALWVRGIIRPEDVNGLWSQMHQTRFEAESAVDRMKALTGFDYDHSPLSARANMFIGFANRTLGETVCFAVINNGPSQDKMVHFQRGEAGFTEAIRIAQQATGATDILSASYAGRAKVRAAQGNWTGAVTDAALVSTSFVYLAAFSTNSGRENNSLVQETYVRREFSVYGSQWAQVFKDPRVPWDTIKAGSGIQKGQDGITPFFRQAKYPLLGSSIALVKGTEMLMLRAEAALRNSDIPGAFTLINQQRASYSLAALPVATTIASAWTTLEKEYGAVVWLEGRRLFDLQRWNADPGPAHNAFLDGRDKCIPISLNEAQTNPNLGKP